MPWLTPDEHPRQVEAARDIALRRLDRCAAPRAVLARALERRGVDPRVAKEALDRLEAAGVIDDGAYAAALARTRFAEKGAARRAIEYMDLAPGMPLRDIRVDTVFLGSCTNGRIEDLRAAAEVVRGRTKAPGVRMLVVPASARIRLQAEAEGLDRVFKDFGAEWRNAGCSMCLGMNPDQLAPGERSASTSNRNFEGRQGKGGRTHLVSPVVAAATAVRGRLSTPADLPPRLTPVDLSASTAA